ncbi:MAG: NUDIX hydrolase [Candidatus Micrarchaeota archaeon]
MPKTSSNRTIRPAGSYSGKKKQRSWAALPESTKRQLIIKKKFVREIQKMKAGDKRAARRQKQLLSRFKPALAARASERSAYFKANRKTPEQMTNYSLINPVASTILYAVDPQTGRKFVFVAERNPAETKTWPQAKVLGGTGKLEAGETGYKHAMRELAEEVGVQEHEIDAIQSVAPVDFAKKAGAGKAYLKGHNYLARVSLKTLQEAARKVNAANGEIINARLVSLDALETLENLQPHYGLILERVIRFLKKEK